MSSNVNYYKRFNQLGIGMKGQGWLISMAFVFILILSGCIVHRKKKCDCPDLRKRKRIAHERIDTGNARATQFQYT